MSVPEDKQTPFGVLAYKGVRAYWEGGAYWISGPPSREGEYERWAYFWWRALPEPLTGYGINLGYEPDNGRWYVVTGPFFEHPLTNGHAPGGLREGAQSETQAMMLIEEGLGRLRQLFTGVLDELLEGAEPPRVVGEPWWDRLLVAPSWDEIEAKRREIVERCKGPS